MSEGWPAAVLQRAKYWIGVDLISGPRQITAAIITAQIVAVRSHGASGVSDVRARRAGIQDGVPNLERPVDRNAATVVAVDSAVTDGPAAIETATGERRIVAAKSAVSKCYVARDPAAVAPWLTIMRASGSVAANGAAGD